MPTYCYRVTGDDGAPTREIVEQSMSFSEHDRREKSDGTIILDDGRIGRREFRAENPVLLGAGRTRESIKGGWPLVSTAAGVSESQVPEERERARRMGFSPTQVDFTPDGDAVFGSRQSQRSYLRKIGMINKDDI